ncbi:MAG: enoyl-CoA hydratase-related protein, partial [Pseudomonadota bacterium]
EARKLGLVDRVAPTGKGAEEAVALAEQILARGADATELTKMLINAAEGEERERVLEALAGRVAAGGDELAEGLAAFFEKRKPDFKR